MSSPNINNLIIIGGTVSYVAVIIAGVDRSIVGPNAMDHICRVSTIIIHVRGFAIFVRLTATANASQKII